MKARFTLLAFLTLLGALPALSQNKTVCPSGCDFTTIQAAVNAASSGDIIELNVNGSITESGITINKNLTIRGLGMNTTFVQAHATRGLATSRVFYLSGGTITFERLAVRHGRETSNTLYNGSGSAMLIDGTGTNVTLNGVSITNNDCVTFTGAGITLGGTSTQLNIYNSSFVGNTVASTSQSGGALYLSAGSVIAKNTLFQSNSAPSSGGAIFLSGSVGATFSNCTFSNNTSTGLSGGVLYANSAAPVFTNCTFTGNSASTQGGALRIGPATITNCTFYQNTAAQGGAIFRSGTNYASPLSLVNCTIASNTASGPSGGGGLYYNSSGGSIVLVNTVFTSNMATAGPGPDMYVTNGSYITTNQRNYVVSAAFGATAAAFSYNSGANLSGGVSANGGLTGTIAVNSGSVLINNGVSTVTGVSIPEKDQRGFVRSGATDIGAFETGSLETMTISYTTLANASYSTSRTLTATISDNIGVPTTGANVPRIYFKRSTASTWFSSAGTLASGSATSGTWNFTISHALLGTINNGDQVNYFVTAQDNTAGAYAKSNSAGISAADVNNIGTYPAANTYTVNVSSMPVSWLGFQGKLQGEKAVLSWATSGEQNSKLFQVERSGDGRSWQVIGTVQAGGTTATTTHYGFEDGSPVQGINYYRIRQLDQDGNYSYSKAISVSVDILVETSVYPNPVSGAKLTVRTQLAAGAAITYALYDFKGLLIAKGTVTSGRPEVDVQHLPKGLYILKVNGSSIKFEKR